jgi:hypothetical protein
MMRRLLEPLAAAEVLGHAAYAPASGDAASPRDAFTGIRRHGPPATRSAASV